MNEAYQSVQPYISRNDSAEQRDKCIYEGVYMRERERERYSPFI